MKKIVFFSFLAVILIISVTGCGKKNPNVQYSQRLQPDTAEYYLNEGILYLNSGDLNTAEQKLMKAIKKKPTLVDAILGLGIINLNRGNFKQAVEYFQQVVRINSNSFDAYNFLGVAYSELGEYNIAKENLLIAANAEKYKTPENAYANLATLEIKQKRYESALRYIEKGMEKNDKFAQLYNLKGVVMENVGKLDDAIAWYQKALTFLKAEDATILINIARIYTKMGNKGKAMDMLEKALPSATSPEIKEQIRNLIKDLEKK